MGLKAMKVYVVMGNDYPAAVYRSAVKAEAYCALRRAQDKVVIPKYHPDCELLGAGGKE